MTQLATGRDLAHPARIIVEQEVEMETKRDTMNEYIIYALEGQPIYRQIQILLVMWVVIVLQILKQAWVVAGIVIAAFVVAAALIRVPEISLILGIAAGIIFGGLLIITIVSDVLKP